MIAKIYSAIPDGYEGRLIEVEGNKANNLPTFNIVGMAAKTVSEARERVRSAITNSNLIFPSKKITINLAPAELAKDGTHLDLPIALAILILSRQLLPSDLDGKLFVGELSLDGQSKPVRGIINIVETAQKAGFKEVYVPQDNLNQAFLLSGIKILGYRSLSELVLHLKNIKPLPDNPQTSSIFVKNTTTDEQPQRNSQVKNTATDSANAPTLDDIRGQALAKRTLIIALAGHHNILFSGPPGAGKTLLAQATRNLLPEMSPPEQISSTKLYSLTGSPNQIISTRPFRVPHHTASSASLIGGGSNATPGEISLAHNGVLFLDELPEYSRNVLEALRQPLEDKQITISRTNKHATYPANFILIATMNPCPCGHFGDPNHECICTSTQIDQYRKRISGPILDRIDLTLNVAPVKQSDLITPYNIKNTSTDTNPRKPTEQETAKRLIFQVQQIQLQRYRRPDFHNGDLPSQSISDYVKLTTTGQNLVNTAIPALNLSARAFYKLLKVARTIADLADSTEVDAEHISEALSLRQALF